MAKTSRSQHLAYLINEAILRSRMKWNEYAASVVTHYHANVDVGDRVIEFHVATTAENHEHASRLNTQTVRRILVGEIRMPSDIEESLIEPLPEAWRERVLSELLARQGLLHARKPMADSLAESVRSPCELMRKAATAVERIAPMLEDNGSIGPEDQPHFADALRAINSVMGCCVTLNTQITDAMAVTPRPGLRAVPG